MIFSFRAGISPRYFPLTSLKLLKKHLTDKSLYRTI